MRQLFLHLKCNKSLKHLYFPKLFKFDDVSTINECFSVNVTLLEIGAQPLKAYAPSFGPHLVLTVVDSLTPYALR